MDPALIRNSFAAAEPPGSPVAAYFHRHLFEHNPGADYGTPPQHFPPVG